MAVVTFRPSECNPLVVRTLRVKWIEVPVQSTPQGPPAAGRRPLGGFDAVKSAYRQNRVQKNRDREATRAS